MSFLGASGTLDFANAFVDGESEIVARDSGVEDNVGRGEFARHTVESFDDLVFPRAWAETFGNIGHVVLGMRESCGSAVVERGLEGSCHWAGH